MARDILIRGLGGMSADPALWPRSVSGGVIDRCKSALSVNMTHGEGELRGRLGQQELYSPLGGSTPTTGMNGPVTGLWRAVTRPGMEYVIVAGYYYVAASDNVAFRVVVFADRIPVQSAEFYLTPIGSIAWLDVMDGNDPPAFAQIGSSVYVSTRRLVGTTLAAWAAEAPTDIGVVRVRFGRSGVTIEESPLFDREINGFGPGDDEGPYMSRAEPSSAMCAFGSRLVWAAGDGIGWSNVGDALGRSANGFARIAGDGDVTALAAFDRYLMVYKRDGATVLSGAFQTPADTSIRPVDGHPGCVSHRGIVTMKEGQIVVSADGIYLTRPDAGAVKLSAAIEPLLRGETLQRHAIDYSVVTPVRESLVNAPAAWLPQRREYVVALSSGRAGTLPWTGNRGTANIRDLWFVAHLPDGFASDPSRIEWHVWRSSSATHPKVAESLLGYIDADGFDTLLSGSHRGRVFLNNVEHTDALESNAAIENTSLTERDIDCEVVCAPIPMPAAGRSRVRSVEVGFAETRQIADATSFTIATSAGGDASYAGSRRTYGLRTRSNAPVVGGALPMTMQTTPSVRRPTGVQGVADADACHVALVSTASMPPVHALRLHVDTDRNPAE